MAERVEVFQVTVPLGTAIAAPLDTVLGMQEGITRRVEILVPPGPSGLVGFRLLHSGTIVVPFAGSRWVIADNEVISWDLDGYPTGNKWTFRAYNTDVFDHTLYLRWLLDEIPAPARTPLVPVAIE